MTKRVKWFRSHTHANRLAALLRLHGVNAEIMDGERGGYVVRYWLKIQATR